MFKNILLLYKKSAYKIYFLERGGFLRGKNKHLIDLQLKKFKKADQEHYKTLVSVKEVLKKYKLNFKGYFRGQRINYGKYDTIITVGGDGTFLEAARNAKKQVIIGVNSATDFSTGSFCVADRSSFERLVKKVLKGQYTIRKLQRLKIQFDHRQSSVEALNDILVCHKNPAMMSRYIVNIGAQSEEQRSSGLWVASPSGSSGAMHSAGGRIIKDKTNTFQYKPRELYPRTNKKYKCKGGVVSSKRSFSLISLMREGVVYVDGAHNKIPFEYGESFSVSISSKSVQTINPK